MSESGAVTAVAWVLNGTPTYCLEGIINYSAGTVAWLKDGLGLIADARDTESLAGAVLDNGGVYLVPAFAGLSAPYWCPAARAAIVGMSAGTTRNHVVRAALESIGYQIRDVLGMMRDAAGVPLRSVAADGGATGNRLLMQFVADVTGLEITVATIPDCSSLGAAMAGMLGTGTRRTLADLAALPREVTRYRPSLSEQHVRASYAGWRRAVQQVIGGAPGGNTIRNTIP